jgi:DNA segregation ATPase FtsK/SpoIIIE, S-DNA-T family
LPHEPLSTRRQLELLRDLQRLANERHAGELTIAQAYTDGKAAAEKGHKQAVDGANKAFEQAKLASETHHQETTQRRSTDYEATRKQLQDEYRRVREEVDSRYTTGIRDAREKQKQARWQAMAVFDAAKNNPREELDDYLKSLAGRQAEIDQVVQHAAQVLAGRHLWNEKSEQLAGSPLPAPNDVTPVPLVQAEQELDRGVGELNESLHRLAGQPIGRMFEGAWPFGLVGLVMVAVVIPFGLTLGWENWMTWVGGIVGGGVLAAILLFVLWRRARIRGGEAFEAVHQKRVECRHLVDKCAVAAREKSRRDMQGLIDQRDTDIRAADDEVRQASQQLEQEKVRDHAQAEQVYPPQISGVRDKYQTESAAADEEFATTRHTISADHERQLQTANRELHSSLERLEQERSAAWKAMTEAWHDGFAAIWQAFEDMRNVCAERFPDWNQVDYATWPKPTEPVSAIAFGEATLDLSKVKHAISPQRELAPATRELKIPTLLTLLEQPSLVVSTEGQGRAEGIELLQTMMVRFLTAMPPGKVRFTICDPLGLGESFSSFMHLADHDEGLINGRIWSESRDIEQQLLRLTNHMETILQKYLRNEYESIHQYNDQAGEVAEPFQVLAVANFPHGFTDTTARRLLNLVSGGPRCGIYVLVSLDSRQRLPNDFPLQDLLDPSVHLEWKGAAGRFVWRYPAFEQLPLELAPSVGDQQLVRLMKQAGATAKESIRVEVPFEVVAPPDDSLWQEECDSELKIPLGRAGANRLHYVRLGKGTSQHLLVAGKTGSGKSTFLHALVTSGALHYSPAELEFYLVDFKKGVEFKAYATHRLPHARVIAIESEREFGLSVLERLDNVLRERGEKFRDAGVQNLADYRAARPDEAVPRVLLIVDEFQELFVEDDRLAQESGLLLDRLVRQGRAFGMHVLLGSQTLAGAYSLARSTLGQMAVRVAL